MKKDETFDQTMMFSLLWKTHETFSNETKLKKKKS